MLQVQLLEELDKARDKTKIIEQLVKILNQAIRKSKRCCQEAEMAAREIDECIT
jgi:predicted secreted protein